MFDDAAILLRCAGRKPGTSTKVSSGMLKASQKRTKRAAFGRGVDIKGSRQVVGLVGDDSDRRPFRRPKPMTMFGANSGWTSKKYCSSRTMVIMSLML